VRASEAAARRWHPLTLAALLALAGAAALALPGLPAWLVIGVVAGFALSGST
jgi:hypothetical protein